MNGSLDAIKNKILAKVSPEEAFVQNICVVMREFHLNYEEIKELPLPTFNIMLKILEKEAKKKPSGRGMQKYVK